MFWAIQRHSAQKSAKINRGPMRQLHGVSFVMRRVPHLRGKE
jgi:hypothetical protein